MNASYNISFTPDIDWFIFREQDGATMRRGFNTKKEAHNFLIGKLATARSEEA